MSILVWVYLVSVVVVGLAITMNKNMYNVCKKEAVNRFRRKTGREDLLPTEELIVDVTIYVTILVFTIMPILNTGVLLYGVSKRFLTAK